MRIGRSKSFASDLSRGEDRSVDAGKRAGAELRFRIWLGAARSRLATLPRWTIGNLRG
jgi:hypothetical protein